jgi:hypothetical protein
MAAVPNGDVIHHHAVDDLHVAAHPVEAAAGAPGRKSESDITHSTAK